MSDDSNYNNIGTADDSRLSAGGKVPRHEITQKLVPNPGNHAAEDAVTIIAGFVGDSDEEGYTRVYCEPTLDCYADVRDEDILHHDEGAGVCGLILWVRQNAKVRYGRRGEGKRAASSFFSGQLLQDYRGGTGGSAGTGGQEPGNTFAWCRAQAQGQEPGNTFAWCRAQEQVGVTGWQGCGQQQHPIGITGWLGCGQTAGYGCPNTSTCTPQTHLLGCPNTSTCTPQTLGLGCPRTSTCPPTAAPGCPNTSTCTPQGGQHELAAAGPGTAATVCTQFHCPTQYGPATVCTHPQFCPHTHLLGCPGTSTCPPQGGAAQAAAGNTYNPGCTLGFTCTYVACPGTGTAVTIARTYDPGCTLGFTCTYVGCPR